MTTIVVANELDLDKYKKAVILRDGSIIRVRPIRREDEDKLITFVSRWSQETTYLRFHKNKKGISKAEAKRFCTVDYNDTFALVATTGEEKEEKIVAVGRYFRQPERNVAGTALVVEDAYQGRGIGTHILEHLVKIAIEKGITQFEADMLAENQQMMQVLTNFGFQITQHPDEGIFRVVLPTAPTPIIEEKSAERDKIATVASLRAFLQPRSIAVIGATPRKGAIGNTLFCNILREEFNGIVYPVNPSADVVASVRAFPSILDIPGEVDLAVVVVPAKAVQKVVQECGQKGVHGVVVISAGFRESSEEGAEREQQLIEIASSYGMRLIGPNCMGVINADSEVSMNATFSGVFPPGGNVAFCSQSGALGLAILEYAQRLNIGLSTFVSIGNRADVSSNDLLQYWQDDPATDVILLYLESFGNPRKSARIARRVSARKPVVVVKSGRTTAGSRAAASHTGALATTEVASDALFKQAGVIRVDTLEDLFDVANLLSHQPLPQGRRVAILTNGGGPGILTADACAARGLELPTLSESTIAELESFMPPDAGLANPIDMTAGGDADKYRRALELLARDENVDTTIIIFIPPIVAQGDEVAQVIREVAPQFRQRGKVLLASFLASRGASTELGSKEEGYVPSFTFPEATATALAKVCEYNEWLKRPEGTIPKLEGIDNERAERIIETALNKSADRPMWLDAESVTELLDAYGVRTAASKTAATIEEAVTAAKEVGFPVVVKLLSDTIAHKTESGGVVLDVRSEQEVEQAFNRIKESLGSAGRADQMQGVLIQAMKSEGVEVIVGVTQDPSFGPLILFGMGGIYTELFKDVTFRIHPLTDVDVTEMIRSTNAYHLLEGWRGAKPSDIEALQDLLLRISAMVEDHYEITELDLNPVKVQEQGAGYLVVDARVMLT